MERGGEGEIQRLLGKKSPTTPQWGLLPRTREFRYPSVALLNREGMESLKARLGSEGEEALLQWQASETKEWWELKHEGRHLTVRLRRKGDEQVELTMSPLTELTQLVMDSPLGVEAIYHSSGVRPWTSPSDKLSQLEHYYSLQSTAVGSCCVHCQEQEALAAMESWGDEAAPRPERGRMIPLSKEEDGHREVIWWCTDCKRVSEIRINQSLDHPPILSHAGIRKFDNEFCLSGAMTDIDFDYYLDKLPKMKAAGLDGLPYELLRDAPPLLKGILFKAVNALLLGTAVPEEWKGGVVKLLVKREPCSELENLRPVTLLQTTYKFFTGVVNDRFQRMMEHSGILESTQEGFRPNRQTRQPISKLQYVIQETRRDKGKLYIAYLDWFSAFTSVSLHKMYHLMELLGMHRADIELIRGAQRGTWTKVSTAYGDTAKIPTTRGTPQGDTLSPSLFCFFINLCLRHLLDAGVGHVHKCGVKRNATCFADDVALIAHSVADMNVLLARVQDFARWSNMDLCLLKCEVTGYNFETGKEEETSAIRIQGKQLKKLSSDSCYKYLGLRLAITGSTKAERNYVLQSCRRAANALKGHAYTTQQALDVIEMAVKPVFGYSCPMTTWKHSELELLEQAWTTVTKRAWGLTLGHNSAPFRLLPAQGGVSTIPAAAYQAKTVTGLMDALRNDADGEIAQLLEQEWGWLQADWGTDDVWGIQLCLLALDSPQEYPTLLSQFLFTLGQGGLTAEIPTLLPQRPQPMPSGSLVEKLVNFLWSEYQEVREGEQDARELQLVARALRKLALRGVTRVSQVQHPTGGWFVDPRMVTGKECAALLRALELSGTGSRYSIREHLQMGGRAAGHGQAQESESEATSSDSGGEEQQDGDEESPQRKIWTENRLEELILLSPEFSPANLLEFVETAEVFMETSLARAMRDEIEEGVSSWAEVRTAIRDAFWPGRGTVGRAVRCRAPRRAKPGPHPAWINESRTTVTAFEGGVYETHIPTGFDSKYAGMRDEQFVQALTKGEPFLVPAERRLIKQWGVPVMPAGWMFKADEWYIDKDKGIGVDGHFTEMRENGATCFIELPLLRRIFGKLKREQPAIVFWMTEEEHGKRGATGVDGYVPPILAFWESQQRLPEDAARRMGARRQQQQWQQGVVREDESGRRPQQLLETKEPRAATESWIDVAGKPRPAEEPIECTLHMDTHQVESHRAGVGFVEYRKASAVWVVESGDRWAVEVGKAKQWVYRKGGKWDGLEVEAGREVDEAATREETGYRTPAWQITQAIARMAGLDTLHGPSVWEMDPTFEKWGLQDDSLPLVLYDAVQEERREGLLDRVLRAPRWAVLTTQLTSTEQQKLREAGGQPWILDYSKKQAVYHKGWWRNGDKRLAQGELWQLWLPPGLEPPAEVEPHNSWCVPWLDTEQRDDLAVYCDGLPAGKLRHFEGRVAWTDGSQRSVQVLGAVAGAGYVTNDGQVARRRVGGMPTAMRAEMAAAAMAVWDTPLDEPLRVVTDSMALIWILRRWRRRDFGFWIDQEQHDDILKSLLARLRLRTARTEFAWCKAHSGNPGNELADIQAAAGCFDERDPVWDREGTTIILREPPAVTKLGEVVSWNGWSRKATKHASLFITSLHRAKMRNTSKTISTVSLVKDGRGRRFLGEALSSSDVPPLAKRDLLQARSFAFPTASVVARYKRGDASAECPFCKKGEETFGHFQCACEEFEGARQIAHDTIAEVLIDDIAEQHEDAVVVQDIAMERLFPGCGATIGKLRPDGMIINHARKEAFLIEFTRGMQEESRGQVERDVEKHMKYHRIKLYLKKALAGYQVKQYNFIMGVLTSIDEERWQAQLGELGMDPADQQRTMRRCVRAGVMALHGMANARRAAWETLRAGEKEGRFDRAAHPRIDPKDVVVQPRKRAKTGGHVRR